MELEDLLAEAEALFEAREPITVPVKLGNATVGVRFLPLSGEDWYSLVQKHPPRSEEPQDHKVRYNTDAVVVEYPDLVMIVGDRVDDMMREAPDGGRFSIWPRIWKQLTKAGRELVTYELWAAHELTPEQVVVEAGKDSKG